MPYNFAIQHNWSVDICMCMNAHFSQLHVLASSLGQTFCHLAGIPGSDTLQYVIAMNWSSWLCENMCWEAVLCFIKGSERLTMHSSFFLPVSLFQAKTCSDSVELTGPNKVGIFPSIKDSLLTYPAVNEPRLFGNNLRWNDTRTVKPCGYTPLVTFENEL